MSIESRIEKLERSVPYGHCACGKGVAVTWKGAAEALGKLYVDDDPAAPCDSCRKLRPWVTVEFVHDWRPEAEGERK